LGLQRRGKEPIIRVESSKALCRAGDSFETRPTANRQAFFAIWEKDLGLSHVYRTEMEGFSFVLPAWASVRWVS